MNFITEFYTNIGSRSENQDCLGKIITENSITCCIADGVGGSDCGSYASKFSVETYLTNVKQGYNINVMSQTYQQIHNHLIDYTMVNLRCKTSATTLSGITVIENFIYGSHVGDTQIWVLRENGIKQLTKNQTEVARLLREGKISKESLQYYPRKHILESALGSTAGYELQTFKFEVFVGDRIILSTDGFYSNFTKREIRDISIKSTTLNIFYNTILAKLNNITLTDNCSFIFIEII